LERGIRDGRADARAGPGDDRVDLRDDDLPLEHRRAGRHLDVDARRLSDRHILSTAGHRLEADAAGRDVVTGTDFEAEHQIGAAGIRQSGSRRAGLRRPELDLDRREAGTRFVGHATADRSGRHLRTGDASAEQQRDERPEHRAQTGLHHCGISWGCGEAD
jgi:hypothetical protein